MSSRFAAILERESPRLNAIADDHAAAPRNHGWSRKQILGHLIDSAGNNHQRIVRTLVSGGAQFPEYQQDSWVAIQRYADAPWTDLLALWLALNRHLLHIVRALPPDQLALECTIGAKEPLPLARVIEGYLDHMEHHLATI